MELRRLDGGDFAAAKRLKLEAFERGRLPDADDAPDGWLDSLQFGIFEGSRMIACATVHAMTMTWKERTVPLGGVAGVACTASQRGRGHVGRLLFECLAAMRDAGQYLSGLHPFSFGFYQRHGWEWVGEKRKLTVPLGYVAASRESRHIETYNGPDALDIVRPIYDAGIRRYRGACSRTCLYPDFWEHVLGDHGGRTTYVHVCRDPDSGNAIGYMTVRYPDPGDCLGVGDFVALSPLAYRCLLGVLHNYGTQMNRATWDAPIDDPIALHVMDYDLKQNAQPLFMGRIVDVAAALTALCRSGGNDGTLVLRVSDPQCSWNDGCFRIEIESGQVAVASCSDEPGVEIDIRRLTQAVWGQPDLQALRDAGFIAVRDEHDYTLLAGLLPAATCHPIDFF